MSCRGKAMHALGECDCYFKPRDFLELVEKERKWFERLCALRDLRPEEEMRDHLVRVMLREHERWLRN
jgi:hypothetical protein